MIFLHLETFENKLVHNISLYSKNHVLTVKPLRKVNFFVQLNFFSWFLLLSFTQIKFWKYPASLWKTSNIGQQL